MRKQNLVKVFSSPINLQEQSHCVLYYIGLNNPKKISKINNKKIEIEDLTYYQYIKLGILNLQKELKNKNKYTKTKIRNTFKLGFYKKEVKDFIAVKTYYYVKESYEILKKAYDLLDKHAFNRNLNNDVLIDVHTQISELVAPYHISTSYAFIHNNNINTELKNYLKLLLKEFENYEE